MKIFFQTTTPSKPGGKGNDSLLSFELLEKDCQIEELHEKLRVAQATINNLKRMSFLIF